MKIAFLTNQFSISQKFEIRYACFGANGVSSSEGILVHRARKNKQSTQTGSLIFFAKYILFPFQCISVKRVYIDFCGKISMWNCVYKEM